MHTISDPKGTHMSCLGVIQRCIKTHLYPVAFIGMCYFSHCICLFYIFISILMNTMLYAISVVCMYVCYVYINRSINQSINNIMSLLGKSSYEMNAVYLLKTCCLSLMDSIMNRPCRSFEDSQEVESATGADTSSRRATPSSMQS